MKQIEEVLTAYAKAINSIDDYFEYRNESIEDRRIVKLILDRLYNDLEKIAKGNQDV